ENADFHQILDFLTSSSINFALTVGDEAINEEMFDSVERDATTASSLEAEHASGNINKTQFTATLNEPFFLELNSGRHTLESGEDNMEHQIELTDNVPNTPHDSPLPGVNTPGSDEGLKKRVTKLEQRQRLRILKNHPFRFGSSMRQNLENQGKIGADDTEVVKGSGDIEVLDTKKAVNTAGEGVSTASVSETVNVEDSSRPVRSITTLQPLPTIDPKDKGKGILQETESVEKTKKKVQGDAQIKKDAKVALRLQAKLDKELRVEREREEAASKVAIAEMFDEVQARMDADYELAARMTQEEQEKYTIEERARLLAEFFERRKKQLAAERAEAIRNKPPTKT
ncbi:hypothetical protein Tco_1106326, partial [Tanacetum coccineum]